MDSRLRDTEETSVPQNLVNKDMENRNEESGNNSSTEADIVHNYNYPVDQLGEIDSRVEEEISQRANAHRAGNNNGDGDIAGNSASGPVKQWGDNKNSTSDAQQSEREKNRRDVISEGDGIIANGKSIATARNDMNAAEMRCEAANKRTKRKDGKRKEDGNSGGRRSMATGREENH